MLQIEKPPPEYLNPNNQKSKSFFKNGISVSKYINKAKIPDSSGILTVLSVGRFIYFKGFSLTIKAFAKFSQLFPNTKLVLVGHGAERKRLEKLVLKNGIKDKVEFRGWLPRDEVLNLMQKADIFIFPSYEGGGMVVVEAMAMGKPIVCLDIGGPGETVTNESGIKVKVQKLDQIIQDLSDALFRLASYPDLRYEMGIKARERIVENYDWDKKGQQIEEIYKLILK